MHRYSVSCPLLVEQRKDFAAALLDVDGGLIRAQRLGHAANRHLPEHNRVSQLCALLGQLEKERHE